MPAFHYKAVAASGEMLEGEMDAPSQSIAIERLQSAGHLPISAEESTSKSGSSRLHLLSTVFQGNQIRSKDINILTRELATLLHAGLPIDHALKTLEELTSHTPVKALVTDIYSRVQGGATLSNAMEAQGEAFSRLYLNTIRAGEASGALDVVLIRLADYMERSAELRASVLSALLYPAILFGVAVISIFVLMTFVVPQFVPLFEDVGQALPLLTQFVFGSAELMRQYWWILFALIAFSAWLINKQLQNPDVQLLWHARSLQIPLYGELITKLEVARFTRTLGTLLVNGVPLLNAVAIVRDAMSNRVLANVIDEVALSLEQGDRLARPLSQSGLFPPLAVQLIQVGEETGQMENMLLKVADIYDNETRITIKRFLTLVEPVLILGLGLVIALIIISILVAMLGLNELVV
jgi:general secretion pathway protein F